MYSAGTASKLQMTLDTNQSSMCFKFLGGSMKKNAALCEAAKGSAPFPRVLSSHPGAQMDA